MYKPIIFTSAEEGGYAFGAVCLSVCLSVGFLGNLWTDFDEIFYRGRAWLKDQVILFWWRSGSRFVSGSPKSEIRILGIGGGLFSVSAFLVFLCLRFNSRFNYVTWHTWFVMCFNKGMIYYIRQVNGVNWWISSDACVSVRLWTPSPLREKGR